LSQYDVVYVVMKLSSFDKEKIEIEFTIPIVKMAVN